MAPQATAAIGKPVPREQRQARRFAQWAPLPALDNSRIGPVAELHHQDPHFPDLSLCGVFDSGQARLGQLAARPASRRALPTAPQT